MQERPGEIGGYWLSKRRGSDNWCRTWFDATTRQTGRASLGTSDLRQAKLRLWEWYARHGTVEKRRDATLELVLVRYWEHHARHLASAEMEKIALRYWSDFFAGALVPEVTMQRQREFIDWLRRDRPLSDGYVKRILTVGKAALNRAWREGEIASAPYIIPGRESDPRKLVLTEHQSAALWDAAEKPHERMFLALAFGTLGRPQALLEVTRGMADLDDGLIDLNPPGRRQTKKVRPIVPIADFLRPHIEQAGPGYLVQWRGKPIASFKTAWRRMRAAAGLPDDAVPKTIRHTMATHLRRSGVPAADVQGMLGHRAYEGKTDVYAHVDPNYLKTAIAAVDAYMQRVSCVLETKKATR